MYQERGRINQSFALLFHDPSHLNFQLEIIKCLILDSFQLFLTSVPFTAILSDEILVYIVIY